MIRALVISKLTQCPDFLLVVPLPLSMAKGTSKPPEEISVGENNTLLHSQITIKSIVVFCKVHSI